jgi:ribose transport system ATP-binding protein
MTPEPMSFDALRIEEVWKSYGGTAALKGANLVLRPGTIHALLGENGAGKSTLIKAITGVHEPDSGTVLVAGERRRFTRPQEAISSGISAVYQERNLVPEFSIAENLYLHDPPRKAGFIHYASMFTEAEPWLREVGIDLDPRTRAAELSVAQGQLVEIARALSLEAQILLLDEPTASLTMREADRLFGILRRLRDRGTAIVFVSHKLEEVFALCDTITVLRDGATVLSSVDRDHLTQADVITAMVGRNVAFTERAGGHREALDSSATALELVGVSTDQGHQSIDLRVDRGEIVALYGLVGAGRTELARTIIGFGRLTAGTVAVNGKPVHIRNTHEAIHRHRIGYVSEDRKGDGLILQHSIAHNVGITIWDSIAGALGFISSRRERKHVAPVVERSSIKLTSLDQPVGQLSGGNQQKVSVSKWLAAEVDILIIDEPTIGVDVRTKDDMYVLLEALAARGIAILLISSDLAEVVRLSDRVAVMVEGRIADTLANTGDYESISQAVMNAIVSTSAISEAAVS